MNEVISAVTVCMENDHIRLQWENSVNLVYLPPKWRPYGALQICLLLLLLLLLIL